MRQTICLLAAFVLAVAAAACGTDLDIGDQQIEGSGSVAVEVRDVGQFDGIELRGEGRVVFDEAAEGTVEVETDDNLVELISTQVEGDTLVIKTRLDRNIEPTSGVEYRVACPQTSQVLIFGAGTVEVGDCVTDQELELAIFGAGSIHVADVDLHALTGEIAGAGEISASGVAEEVEFDIPGAGEFDGADLETADVQVEIQGDGSATVWATESLDVRIIGKGDVAYYGNPTVSQSVVGVGSVEARGDK